MLLCVGGSCTLGDDLKNVLELNTRHFFQYGSAFMIYSVPKQTNMLVAWCNYSTERFMACFYFCRLLGVSPGCTIPNGTTIWF